MPMRQFASGLLLSLALAFPTLAPAIAADGVIASHSEAINKAGRQRMLTQRIVKSYCQLLLEVDLEKSGEQLKGAMTLYEKQLAELKQFAGDPAVQKELAAAEKLWQAFAGAAAGAPSPAGLEALRKYDDPVLQASHHVVELLEKGATTHVGHLVNIAGRQRMISQRIAKFYMLRTLGDASNETEQGMNKAAQEFRVALDELLSADQNTPEIQKSLEGVKTQWSVFEAAFRLDKGEYAPLMIARYSEKILVSMNEITGLYEKLAAR